MVGAALSLKKELDEFLEKNIGAEILSILNGDTKEGPHETYIFIIYRTNKMF